MSNPASHADENAAAAPAAPRGSVLGKLLVVMLVVVVVVVECVVAYVCIPAADASASAGPIKPPTEHKKGEAEPAAAGEGEKKADTAEFDMKEYSITKWQPASNSTIRVDFHLYGIVATENKEEFKRLFEENAARFKEQVNMTIRATEMADLEDTSLGLIKRTILDRAQHTFGKPLLKEITIPDFTFIEQ